MPNIRSFLYLDQYKLYSFSSQLFEGLTDYIIRTRNTAQGHSESRDMISAKGRKLAELVAEQQGITEMRFLHDSAYNLFEEELQDQRAILDINSSRTSLDLTSKDFVRIRGTAVFNDVKLLKRTLEEFNKAGEALTYVTEAKNFQALETTERQLLTTTKDRNQRAVVKAKVKHLKDLSALAQEKGLKHDGKFLNSLAYLLAYGYEDQLEIRIPIRNADGVSTIYSATLDRSCLREKEVALITKYSRKTERELTLFGVLTQRNTSSEITSSADNVSSNDPDESEKSALSENPPTRIKEGVLNMIDALAALEASFTGKLQSEVIIDPVAVYLELHVGEKGKEELSNNRMQSDRDSLRGPGD
jgi:hypothetical protein